MTRRITAVVLLVALVAGAGTAAQARSAVIPPTAAALVRDVATLADPSMEGRASGTPGGARAAVEIARWLADAGLQPGGDRGTFLQSFVLAAGTRVAPESVLETVGPAAHRVGLDGEWRPHGGSLTGDATAGMVFAGYGITSADGRWDDYRGVDVRGRVVLALDGAPDGVTAGTGRLEKLIAARRAGAAALLLVGDPLPTVDATAAPVAIVSGAITRAAADALLRPAGHTVRELEAGLAARRAPASIAIRGPTAHVRVALAAAPELAANVIGILPGRDPRLAREAVVIGAHYDHLGVRGGQLHPGADDNASGTATVVALARAVADAGGAPRTLVFALFGAEELGLIGSREYVEAPAVPLARTVAMVNLDMVGRLGGQTLAVGGVDSGVALRQVVTDAGAAAGVGVAPRGQPFAPSDHVRFYRAGVPVVFLHTGEHADYHRPTDTVDRIDAPGMARLARFAAALVERLATGPPPAWVRLVPSRPRATTRGGAFLGVVADPRGMDGVKLADVLPDSAAARAGVRAGDVLVRFAGESLRGFDDLRHLVERRKPGDTVDLVYLHNGEDRTVSAALDARP